MKLFYITLLTLLGSGILFAQKDLNLYQNTAKTPSGHIRCLTMEADSLSRLMHPERGGSIDDFERWIAPRIEEYRRLRAEDPLRFPPVLTIPVVVHVIHNGDALGTGENISDAQVLSQIRVMNEDFRRMLGTPGYNTTAVGADVEVEFCMAQTTPTGQPTNGINRIQRTEVSWTSMAAIDGTLKPATIWSPTEYLNMWSVRFGGGMAGTLGYAQFPDNSGLAGLGASGGAANSDGVVASFDAFGSQAYAAGTYNATYNLGRTMTHEVGHWLGLRHIWGDGPCNVDDFCNDTPLSAAANFGCPNINSCADPAPNPRDMVENYMDYTDDACMNIFTADQKTRIRTVMTVSPRRMELPLSNKCQPPYPMIGFTTNETTITEGTDCNFQDIVLTLNISMAPSANATVTFNTTGTATGGALDYSFTPASVVFPAGSTPTRTVTVRIYNDGVVEPTENVLIAFTVTTTGNAGATTSDLRDHNIIINDEDYAPTPIVNINILNADFNAGFNGFTSTGNAGSDRFVLGNAATASSAFWTVQGTNTTPFAYSNDDRCNCSKAADRLISPTFSLVGYANATLTFDHAFAAGAGETANIQISTNGGGVWTTLQAITNTSANMGGGILSTPWQTVSINLNTYIGQATVMLRFNYNDGNGWNYGLAVDNVKVFSTVAANVQTAVNTTNKDFHQVRSNETTHWYDPASSRVMGTIVNTSTWNYNCTSMEVNRDQTTVGATTAPFWNTIAGDRLMAKTFYVSPANNTPTGTYNVTFYFTAAEITAWETATGKSRNNLKIVKVANNPISAVNAGNYNSYNIQVIPATLGTFGTNFTLTASFASGFSGFGFGDPVPPITLPIELVDFKAKREYQNVRLNWVTASEINNDYFMLERSADGMNFDKLAKIEGAGNSSIRQSYSYLDKKPLNGYNYYRLIQVDTDGNETKSAVVSVDMAGESATPLALFPNPVRNELNINFNAVANENISIEVFDMLGKQLMQQNNLNVELGANSLILNINDFSQGMYLLRITQGELILTKKFVKE